MAATAGIAAEHGSFNRIRQVAPRCNPSNTCFLEHESVLQTTPRSVQPFLQGTRSWDKYTDI